MAPPCTEAGLKHAVRTDVARLSRREVGLNVRPNGPPKGVSTTAESPKDVEEAWKPVEEPQRR